MGLTTGVGAFVVPNEAAERLVTAIDQAYAVRDMGIAGDSRIYEVLDPLTGEYVATMLVWVELRGEIVI